MGQSSAARSQRLLSGSAAEVAYVVRHPAAKSAGEPPIRRQRSDHAVVAVWFARGEGVTDTQPEMEGEPGFWIAELMAADLLDATQPVRHRISVQVQL